MCARACVRDGWTPGPGRQRSWSTCSDVARSIDGCMFLVRDEGGEGGRGVTCWSTGMPERFFDSFLSSLLLPSTSHTNTSSSSIATSTTRHVLVVCVSPLSITYFVPLVSSSIMSNLGAWQTQKSIRRQYTHVTSCQGCTRCRDRCSPTFNTTFFPCPWKNLYGMQYNMISISRTKKKKKRHLCSGISEAQRKKAPTRAWPSPTSNSPRGDREDLEKEPTLDGLQIAAKVSRQLRRHEAMST